MTKLRRNVSISLVVLPPYHIFRNCIKTEGRLQDHDPSLPKTLAQSAIKDKDHIARDAVFDHASKEKKQVVREAVLAQIPSFARLVSTIVQLLKEKLAPEPVLESPAETEEPEEGST